MERLVDCTGCKGDCCKNTILTDEEAKSGKYDMFRGMIPETSETAWFLKMKDDGKCVYLNRETWKCNIYEERPTICREQTCGLEDL